MPSSSILPPCEVDILGVFVQRVSQSFQGHVECSIPGHSSGRRRSQHPADLSEFCLRTLSHVSGLVELPELAFRDLVVCGGNDRLSHISVCLIVADILVSELIADDVGVRCEGVEGALAFVVHGSGEEHDE